MKQIKDIREIKPSGNTTWIGGAYTIAFVYSNKGNFILKGYMKELEEELKRLKSKGYKYFVGFSLWSKNWKGKSESRDIWKFYHKDYTLVRPWKEGKRWSKWKLVKRHNWETVKEFKRLPKRWIPEFDNL